jgi:hypothetical protein
MRVARLPCACLLLLLAACGSREARGPGAAADSGVATDSAAANPSAAAARPPAAMRMLPGLRAHLDSVAARPAMLHGAMAAHEDMVKAAAEAMHADMVAAGMHSDPDYEALADSVVKGSAEIGAAKGKEFDRLVMRHVDQTRRLAAIYETKVAQM